MNRKKITAVLLASLMGISVVPANVWAADSYKETEKAAVAKAIEEFAAEYAQGKEQISDEVTGTADIKVTLDESGKAILGMLMPVDVSWLQDASITGNVGFSADNLTENLDVNVNGTKICTVEYAMDTANSEIYMRIPELSESYIKVNMVEMTQEAVEEADQNMDSSFSASMDIADAMSGYFGALENLPEADTLQSILTRYTDIILDNVADAENPGAQTVTAGGVSQELTILEGHVTQKEALPMMQEILSTAKEDEDLKGLVDAWTAVLNDPDYTYETFLEALSELEGELPGEEGVDESDESGFVLRAWVDADGSVVGRQFLTTDGTADTEENLISYLNTVEGDNRGFSMTVGSEDSGDFTVEGSGALSGDLLSGTYTVSTGGTDAVVIDVADYDTKAMADGIWKGAYTISGAPVESEDGTSYDPFGGMQIVFTTTGEDENHAEMDLALVASGSNLGSLTITGSNGGEAPASIDVASLTDVYDFSNEDDINNYAATINLDAIMNNLTAAGMPDGWLDSVANVLAGSGSEEAYDDSYDGTEEDQTDMAGDTLDDSAVPAA